MIKKLFIITVLVIGIASSAFSQLFYKDVAPIFYDKCASCHHAGNVYPPLNYYSSVSGFTGLIANDLNTNKMPPWPPDTSYTRFVHERVITLSEKTKILTWISTGAAMGDTTLAPPAPLYPMTILNGTPDLILTVPSYTSTATSSDKYICFTIPTGLTQNRILRAYEIVPNNPSIIHHSVINVDTLGTSTSDLTGGCYTIGGDFNIGDYAPGSQPIVFPNSPSVKFGVTIKAGSNFVAQVHYPAGSAGQVDNTQIRLFFYPVGTVNVRQIYATTPLQNWSFNIPANVTKTVTAVYPTTGGITADISLFSIFPHSHGICKSIENYATNGTSTIPLCKIPKWDFDWQGFYTYKNLVKIPIGYKLYGKHVFDNTAANPNSVPFTVFAGPNTANEMVFDGIMFALYNTGDELIDIKSIIDADPLFNNIVNVPTTDPIAKSIAVYPNPFSDKISIQYSLFSEEATKLLIYNSMGQEVMVMSDGNENIGLHSYEWNGKNKNGIAVAAGIYNYKLQIGDKSYFGKIVYKSK
jgi:FlgD Ig-like domain